MLEKPSDIAKAHGYKSLKQLAELSGTSVRTLISQAKNKPELFLAKIENNKSKIVEISDDSIQK